MTFQKPISWNSRSPSTLHRRATPEAPLSANPSIRSMRRLIRQTGSNSKRWSRMTMMRPIPVSEADQPGS